MSGFGSGGGFGTGFNNKPPSSFGGPPPAAPFGNQQQSSAFGGIPPATFGGGGSGGGAPFSFGGSSSTKPPSGTSTASGMTFGMSTNFQNPSQPAAPPFGSSPAATAPPFGSSPPAPFGSSLATPAGPFGASPAPPTTAPFGSSPFGNTTRSTNMAPPATPPNNNNNNPFGGGGGGVFGNASNTSQVPSLFGSSTSSTTAAQPIAFGTSSNFASPPASTFGNNTKAPAPSPWQQQQNSMATTASSSTASNNPFAPTSSTGGTAPFRAVIASSNAASSSPFGTNTTSGSNPFGNNNSGSSRSTLTAPNPFAPSSSAGSSAPVTFATSSNFMDDDNMGGSSTHAASSSSTLFATAPSFAAGPFAGSGNTTSGNSTMKMDNRSTPKDKKQKAPRSDLPFGTPQSSGQRGASSNSDDNPFAGAASSTAVAGATWPPPHGGGKNQPDNSLLSTLEEKKKKLEKLRRKKEEEATKAAAAASRGSNSPAPFTGLNPSAAPFAPRTETSPAPATAAPAGSLAERNAARFDGSASNSATWAHLPSDLQAVARQAVNYAALRNAGGGREVLGEAKSLVGTCMYMCPDEELLRRESENDIQLLELVKPSTLHPPGWTLRDTAIKRFRRSAADFKLDVPEWVRPPDVLEKVCAYLEEWVMERDRQGPDPRFKGVTPPPLDVYQFIWDRTRMIRKDFTLQNYVGTGGNCDARAVRCHERIARWHAMCEHQLSHISDFVVMQSQQNIQELGQTMKTLNLFYDDALKRSRVEVPDENGRETRTDLGNYSHGCQNSIVQGEAPTDYEDGEQLLNVEPSGNRLVGKDGVQQYHHGTAEPEMRGLYILLTIDNDGGMEVMRYAALLSRERPEIFHSAPVQLALKIYKSKQEENYARFFRILRSSSTPYLYACIMFKYVQSMRSSAFMIMSKTYGGKRNDATLYDQYQLKDLIRTLCFEDEEEAVAACQHYNITVKDAKVKTQSGAQRVEKIVFWKVTDFEDPIDPDKGTPIPLRPKKMVSTIERKRKGATRLAVCRGDVSGDGAFLNSSGQTAVQNMSFEDLARRQTLVLQAMQDEEEKQSGEEQMKKEARAKEEEQRRLLEDRKKQEAMRLQQERAKQEADRLRQQQMEEEKRLAKEREIAREKAKEAERLRKLEEEHLERERKLAEEARLKRLEEERIQREKEEEERQRQRRLEEERKERERQKVEEERRKQEAERERLRKEEEARLLELARIREAERRIKEAEERRANREWNDKISNARKLLTILRWKQKMPRCVEMYEESKKSLLTMKHNKLPPLFLRRPVRETLVAGEKPDSSVHNTERGLRLVIDSLLKMDKPLQLGFECLSRLRGARDEGDSRVFLMKIAIFFPESVDDKYLKLCSLVHAFAAKRLRMGFPAAIPCSGGETRIVFVDGNNPENRDACDGVLVVVPSADDGIPADAMETMSPIITSVPRAALLLTQKVGTEHECYQIHRALAKNLDSDDIPLTQNTLLSEEAVDNALMSAVESIVYEVVQRPPLFIRRISVERLGIMCLNEILWLDSILDTRDGLVETSRRVLAALVDQLDSFGKTGRENWNWPSGEFVSNSSVVKNYFGSGLDLPIDWAESLSREKVTPPLEEFAFRLSGTLPQAVSNLLGQAPEDVIDECRELMDHRMFRRCLQRALLWRHENQEPWQSTEFVYLPQNLVCRVIERTLDAVQPVQRLPVTFDSTDSAFEESENDFKVLLPAKQVETFLDPVEELDEIPPASVEDALSSRKRVSTRLQPSQEEETSFSSQRASKRLRESRDLTRRLEAMAAGDLVPPVFVGNRPLAALLRGAEPPVDPRTWRNKRRTYM